MGENWWTTGNWKYCVHIQSNCKSFMRSSDKNWTQYNRCGLAIELYNGKNWKQGNLLHGQDVASLFLAERKCSFFSGSYSRCFLCFSGDSQPLDVCSIWHERTLLRYSVSLVGYGFYADVVHASEKHRWMGPARYTYAGIWGGISWDKLHQARWEANPVGHTIFRLTIFILLGFRWVSGLAQGSKKGLANRGMNYIAL